MDTMAGAEMDTGRQYIGRMITRMPAGIRFGASACQVCGRWPGGPVCAPCLQTFVPPEGHAPSVANGAISTIVTAVDYGYPWDRLITRFKFSGDCGLAPALAAVLASAAGLGQLAARCDLVVPIPLSLDRLAQRGYNQSWELARRLAGWHPTLRGKGRPLAMTRRGGLPDQHTLNRRQRLDNLDRAFAVAPQFVKGLRGAHVMLVDDVVTTGATLQKAAHALLAAGATSVSAAVLARTP